MKFVLRHARGLGAGSIALVGAGSIGLVGAGSIGLVGAGSIGLVGAGSIGLVCDNSRIITTFSRESLHASCSRHSVATKTYWLRVRRAA